MNYRDVFECLVELILQRKRELYFTMLRDIDPDISVAREWYRVTERELRHILIALQYVLASVID